MKKLVFRGPINSLSFGNVSVNFLREFYRREMQIAFFPIGDQMDFTTFDKVDDDFKSWVKNSFDHRFSFIDKDIPGLAMWHLNGSEVRITRRQYLYTFYECDNPTFTEKQIANLQDKVFFSSTHAKNAFSLVGCENISAIPLGFDCDFHETNQTYLEGKVHFGLMGKFEKRKHTEKIIKLWIKKYGNNPKYQLSCCVTNPFFKPEQMNGILGNLLEGKNVGNVNFLPFLQTNSDVNEFLNSIDIDLSGLSGAEGWNLPSFNASCLGKWSVVLNASSHKDWATSDNSILISPSQDIPIYDGAFFHEGSPFNQGSMRDFKEEDFYAALEEAESKIGKRNTEGVKLKDKFNYKKTITSILRGIQNIEEA